MNIWKLQEEEELNQEVYNFEVSQPLVKKDQALPDLNNDNEEMYDNKGFGKKIISTFLIFLGAYLIYSGSLIIFQVFIANLANFSSPITLLFIFIIGILFMIIGNGQFQKRSNYLIHLSIPLISLILGFLFTLAPEHWQGGLFGGYSLLFFPLVLFVFYYLKENFTAENK